jgi:hypothetical protein
MIAHHATRVVILICCALASACGGDDREVVVLQTKYVGQINYEWVVNESRLSRLPHWNPATDEPPLSLHQAVVAATEFARIRFGSSVRLDVGRIYLDRQGIGASSPDIWIYEVHFACDPDPPYPESEFLQVIVLMDGKVVVPRQQPAQ